MLEHIITDQNTLTAMVKMCERETGLCEREPGLLQGEHQRHEDDDNVRDCHCEDAGLQQHEGGWPCGERPL